MSSVDKSESRLCVACGLCCDGTLFSFVPLSDADAPVALGANFELRERDGAFRFRQPCPESSGQGCGIYEHRPAPCRKFSCRVLTAYREGWVQLAEAEGKIRLAKRLRRELVEAMRASGLSLAGGALSELWGSWNERAQSEEGQAFLHEHGALMVRMAALNWFVQRHFWSRNKER